jgi:transcriptional regulator with XRE-family HTH domain
VPEDRTELLLRFGRRVQRRRRDLGLSQEALAERAGLHRTYVGSLERGERNVALLNLVALARALNLRTAEMLDGVDEPDSDF